ncbi:uncharacterized protein LY89DRAFT_160101 [Mollisia scopiformis]|uniref:Uncharacterized protein n=1 Tax=Mollisia scopiformis TaxID=149040 RepID=A0A194X125_MOLSC|nr:uncharacterized protein LY89DRAFT_160101 [Mollisia scopiformis]KUJ13567.1 hypothetical protein LY89DRAFT_160101 [Mollisia scopiformis]
MGRDRDSTGRIVRCKSSSHVEISHCCPRESIRLFLGNAKMMVKRKHLQSASCQPLRRSRNIYLPFISQSSNCTFAHFEMKITSVSALASHHMPLIDNCPRQTRMFLCTSFPGQIPSFCKKGRRSRSVPAASWATQRHFTLPYSIGAISDACLRQSLPHPQLCPLTETFRLV